MANIQKELITFHNTIKVDEDELRDSRDALLKKIKETLKKNGCPVPVEINQGSYIYGVGIEPIEDLEHDIDTGLEFSIVADDYDAKDVRKWVYDAVKNHTSTKPKEKRPCIRVFYKAGHHVDLVIYAKYKTKQDKEIGVENHQIALENGEWRPSEPKRLKKIITESFGKFEETKVNGDANQLQRVVRCYKRWFDFDMPYETKDKPVGLAILLYAMEHLQPHLDLDRKPDDLAAIKSLACTIKNTLERLRIKKPTQEYEEMFEKISDKAMDELKKRAELLYNNIIKVEEKASTEEACKIMVKEFGDDFPVIKNKKVEDEAQLKSILTTAASKRKNGVKPWSQ